MAASPSPSPSPSPSLSAVRSWRMAFLTLRDETLTSPPSTAVVHLLNHLIFSNSDNLIRVASDLPSHEVTSDLMFLMEVARTTADSAALNDDVYDVSHRVSLDINSSYWALMLDSFGRMVEIFLGKAGRKRVLSGNVSEQSGSATLHSDPHTRWPSLWRQLPHDRLEAGLRGPSSVSGVVHWHTKSPGWDVDLGTSKEINQISA
ncbi:hypothetical protein TEA_002766 [Camellia sinensis var. sinensis]|uniref:Uncharacterized protein n=1 Tax=Camellia sinensis var. sinensis TaxID=542762 RepID=A0A4S4EJI7_CAMSN|nr:hypothetical protein TEA_002766 [Camellia sinensis var. sinensis]